MSRDGHENGMWVLITQCRYCAYQIINTLTTTFQCVLSISVYVAWRKQNFGQPECLPCLSVLAFCAWGATVMCFKLWGAQIEPHMERLLKHSGWTWIYVWCSVFGVCFPSGLFLLLFHPVREDNDVLFFFFLIFLLIWSFVCIVLWGIV